jgi:hypothetical protein
MATDDKVAFYLRHRSLIEEWAALRERAATEPEEALVRAVGIIRQRLGTPEIVENDSRRYPTYSISLQVPGAEPTGSCLSQLARRGPTLAQRSPVRPEASLSTTW